MIEVLEPGPLSSVQDAVGRVGWRHVGVPVGGAADPWAARLANRLVGNPDAAALVEVTLGGAAVRLDADLAVAVTGGLKPAAGGLDLALNLSRALRSGTTIRLAPGGGARGYLAIGGGLVVRPVLGSASTDLRSGFGGLGGRALRAGDRLEVGRGGGLMALTHERTSVAGPIRVVAGPYEDALAALLAGAWTVGVETDRAGVRLDGPALDGAEVPSMGLPLGAIQVAPDGRPIVMLVDRPVTGGYAVPACVIRADIGRVAQLRTGDQVTFASVTRDEARAALIRAEDELASVEPSPPPTDDELGWVGSHG